jgi:dipeptidyl aminopeptidase/acylaminoacyl peptidase
MVRRSLFLRTAVIIVAFLFISLPVIAQEVIITKESYIKPPKEILDIVNSPRYKNYTLSNTSPNLEFYLNSLRSGNMVPVALMGKPYYNLGGSEFDPKGNRARTITIGMTIGFELIDWKTGDKIQIQTPKDTRVSNPVWSPDGLQLAYFVHFDDATHIYIYDVRTGRSRQLTTTPVLATHVTSFEWTEDGQKIFTVLIPEGRGPEPIEGYVTEPYVRVTRPGSNPSRTDRFLMDSPYDFKLFEYYSTGQIVYIEVRTGKVTNVGKPNMYTRLDAAPNGQYLRVTTMLKPFSYLVSASSFGSVEQMWDVNGKVLCEFSRRTIRESGQVDTTAARGQAQGAATGKRSLAWAPDGNGMIFLRGASGAGGGAGGGRGGVRRGDDEEQQPPQRQGRGGAGTQQQAPRPQRNDSLMRWLPPFDSTSVQLIYEQREAMNNVQFSEDLKTLFISESRTDTNFIYLVNLDTPTNKQIVMESKTSERLKNPGTLMTKRGPNGSSVVRRSSDKQYVYFSGTQSFENPEVNPSRAFIDKVKIGSPTDKMRIFYGNPDYNESISTVLDDDLEQVMTTRSSRTEVPDSYLRNLKTGDIRKMTNNVDYSPEITRAQRRNYRAERPDGFTFNVKVTLPENYVEGTKLPALFWFYPSEFAGTNPDSIQMALDRGGQNVNRNAFPTVGNRSMEIFVKLGYALVEPDCPIIGPTGLMNDNYLYDLLNNLWATIDLLDKKAIIDRDRLAIGGHSYGAFSTANALAHTPFFKAGIAGDGCYNRTLTPMTFQNERRDLWTAQQTYLEMSPLLYADNFTGALLMYHGMDDANVGTDPINSPRLFQALQGNGKMAALYMYPYEDHGPLGEETIIDTWARWVEWLDIWVMHPERGELLKKK